MATTLIQNDIGKEVRVETGIDLTAFGTLQMKVRKPSATLVTWTAAKDATDDSVMTYTTVSGDLNEVGRYYLHAYATDGSTVHTGDRAHFDVLELYT